MSELSQQDWQQILSAYVSHTFAWGTFNQIVGFTPGASTEIEVSDLKMIPSQWAGAHLRWITPAANSQETFEITDNTETDILFEPAINHYTGQFPAAGDLFIITGPDVAGQNVNVEEWGGVVQTGDDLTPFFQNIDYSLADLLDELLGPDDRSLTDLYDLLDQFEFTNTKLHTTVLGRGGDTITIATAQDISAGVSEANGNYNRWTLYLTAADAIDIDIELSPDGGATWYDLPESPIAFAAAGDDIIEFGYDATNIRLTGSNANLVTAQIRGLY